jgi:N6-adenosine-specific RNA methylase IME4
MALDFHPLANLFPLIEGAEFDDLAADIRAHGQHEDIVLLENKILDGRNRYRACGEAGIEPRFVPFQPDHHGSPLEFVLSKNLRRRHLNESQRAMVAAKLANMRQGERTDQPSANLQKVAQADAARLLNVSSRTVADAVKVAKDAAPELQRAVDHGRLSVSQAAIAARLNPERQAEVARRADAGEVNAARTVIKQGVRQERERALGGRQVALPDRRFGCILADPEWDRTTWSEAGRSRHADNHYTVSSNEVIASRNVPSIAAPDSICGLWCTDPHRGIDVLRAWGFEPKSYFVWVKDIVEENPVPLGAMLRSGAQLMVVGAAGNGYWNRDRDELFLIGTRGRIPCPAPGTQGESVWFARRPTKSDSKRPWHSAKPACAHEWFERHFPTLSKIELNARLRREGWESWGNEIE